MSRAITAGTLVAAIVIAGACVKERVPVRQQAIRQANRAVGSSDGQSRDASQSIAVAALCRGSYPALAQ